MLILNLILVDFASCIEVKDCETLLSHQYKNRYTVFHKGAYGQEGVVFFLYDNYTKNKVVYKHYHDFFNIGKKHKKEANRHIRELFSKNSDTARPNRSFFHSLKLNSKSVEHGLGNITPVVYSVVYDQDGLPRGIIIEHIEGETLFELVNEERISYEQATKIINKVEEILNSYEKLGFVHGDPKLENIMVMRDTEKLGDFKVKLIDPDISAESDMQISKVNQNFQFLRSKHLIEKKLKK